MNISVGSYMDKNGRHEDNPAYCIFVDGKPLINLTADEGDDLLEELLTCSEIRCAKETGLPLA